MANKAFRRMLPDLDEDIVAAADWVDVERVVRERLGLAAHY
jgi:hypothetical protein